MTRKNNKISLNPDSSNIVNEVLLLLASMTFEPPSGALHMPSHWAFCPASQVLVPEELILAVILIVYILIGYIYAKLPTYCEPSECSKQLCPTAGPVIMLIARKNEGPAGTS